MKEHPHKWKLEKYLGIGKALSEIQNKEISDHVDECHYCAKRIETLRNYHQEIEEQLNQPMTEEDETEKISEFNRQERKLIPSQSLIEDYGTSLDTSSQLVPTMMRYVRRHPSRVVLVAVASVLFMVTLVFKPWQTQNPVYANVDNNILRVMNENGELIWKMKADGIPEGVSSKEPQVDWNGRTYIKLANIDKTPGNELLISGDNVGSRFSVDTLYCYNRDGSLRWKKSVADSPPIQEVKNANIGWWEIYDTFVFKPSNESNSRLYVLAKAGRWAPSVFYEIDATTGKILQSYWHDGHLETAKLIKRKSKKDKDRLVLGAISGAFNRASLVVLNPDSIAGIGTGSGLFKEGVLPKANEKIYITFKPSILAELYRNAPYNQFEEIILANNGNIIVRTRESYSRLGPDQGGSVYYILDENLEVIDVYGGDSFLKRYTDLYKERKSEIRPVEEYFEQLKDSVRYLVWE